MPETDHLNRLNTTIAKIQQAGMFEKPKIAEQALLEAVNCMEEMYFEINVLKRTLKELKQALGDV